MNSQTKKNLQILAFPFVFILVTLACIAVIGICWISVAFLLSLTGLEPKLSTFIGMFIFFYAVYLLCVYVPACVKVLGAVTILLLDPFGWRK